MRQTVRVARIQLVNALAVLGLPVAVLFAALAANVVIFLAVGASNLPPEDVITGALMSIYIVVVVSHIQTMTQMFPFALGMSVTRRSFVNAAALIVGGQALAYGLLLFVLKLIENATGGWGLNVTMFALPFMEHSNPLAQILIYTVPFLFLSFLGLWAGIVYHRWGQWGVWALVIGFGAIGVALVAMATWQGWWPAVGGFFADQPALALFAGYPLVLAALVGGCVYLTSRRAVP